MANVDSDNEVSEEAVIIRSHTSKQEAILMVASGTKEMSSQGDWIKSNIKKRVCNHYVKAIKPLPNFGAEVSYCDLGETCECGHTQQEHSSAALASGNAKGGLKYWNIDRHTTAEATDAYGELDFIDSSRKVAKFVRIDEHTSSENIKHLLFHVWKLGKPTLVISVIGDASRAKPRALQAVRRGLVKVMRSGAWTISGGVKQGIMRVVGEAANTTMSDATKTVCLGIVPWGVLANRQQLVAATQTAALTPVRYVVSNVAQTCGLSLALEPNHTHFLLVDNGTARLSDTETVVRTKVEDMLANLTQSDLLGPETNSSPAADQCFLEDDFSTLTGALQVPLCYVLCGGDARSFALVRQCLRKRTPVVVVAGTGGMADLIACVLNRTQVSDSTDEQAQGRMSVHRTVTLKFSEKSDSEILNWLKKEKDVNELTNTILSVVHEHIQLLHIFDANGQKESDTAKSLDVFVLQAILRSGKLDKQDVHKTNQLALALQWNRSDIAQDEIFSNDFKVPTSVLTQLFTKAVALDRPAFVRLFIDQGFSLREYLTVDILADLYNQYIDTPFAIPLSKESRGSKGKRNPITLADVGRAITNLCGAMYYSSYQHDPAECGVSYSTLLVSEKQHLVFLKQRAKRKKSDPEKKLANADYSLGDPAMHLFFFAVLMNRKELAMVFWRELTQNLASALTASFFFGKLIKYATDRDVREEVTANSAYFGDLAVGVLDACYSADQDHSHLLILRELREFAGATCMELAEISGNMPFIAHPASQTLMQTVWFGEIRGNHSTFLLLLCSLLPPLIPLFVKFQRKPVPRVLTSILPPTLQTEARTDIETDDSYIRPPPPVPSIRCCKLLERILHFYVSPQITFINDVVAYLLFLVLFTIMVIGEYVDDCEADMTALEWTLVVWVLCLFAEELRQLTSEPGTVSHKFVNYIRNPWNQLDVLSISFLLVGEILASATRLCYMSLPYIRVLVGVSIFIFYTRLLQFFSANKYIGPKLIMIFRMLKDVLIIMSILIVIVIGFTVVVVSVTMADQNTDFPAFTGVLSQVYWAMFGNSPVSTFSNITSIPTYELVNGTPVVSGYIPDPIGGYYLVLFLGFFVILTNLLLFNVLIAMFNYTFATVQDKADEYWCNQRYKLITEYYARPPIPPPLLLLYHFWLLLKYIYGHIRSAISKDDRVVLLVNEASCKVKCNDAVERQLITWEDIVVDEYLDKLEIQEKEKIENQVELVREHTGTIKDVLQYVANAMENADNASTQAKITGIEQRLTKLESKTEELNTNVKEILQLLRARTNE